MLNITLFGCLPTLSPHIVGKTRNMARLPMRTAAAASLSCSSMMPDSAALFNQTATAA
jgi:hypothetical protein